MSISPPVVSSPLKYDSEGNVRILIWGNSGTGKSTIAVRLRKMLQCPVIHLDRLYWKPNWEKKDDVLFRKEVEEFIFQNKSWVIDGNFMRVVGDLTYGSATNIVWMDPPFALYFSRLLIRTFLRLFGATPPCSPGCDETLSDIFTLGQKSILWWGWTNHTPQRKKLEQKMREENNKDKMWIRLGGWGGEVRAWLENVQSFVRKR